MRGPKIRSHKCANSDGTPCKIVFDMTACTTCQLVAPKKGNSKLAAQAVANFYAQHKDCYQSQVTEMNVKAFINFHEKQYQEQQQQRLQKGYLFSAIVF